MFSELTVSFLRGTFLFEWENEMGIVSWEMAESCLCFLLLLMAGSAGSPGAQQGGGRGGTAPERGQWSC